MNFVAPIIVEVSYEETVNFHSMHYNVKRQASVVSSKIKIDLNEKEGSILINNDIYFLSIPSAIQNP